MTTSRLADRLYELRTKKRIHQKVLAEAIGVRPPMDSRIEKGERRPKFEQLDILSDIFELDRKELRALLVADKLFDIDNDISKDVVEYAFSIVQNEFPQCTNNIIDERER